MTHDSSPEPESTNTTTNCTRTHPAVLDWHQRELEELCSRQVVKGLCATPTCDVAMVTHMVNETSHYLLAAHYSDPVFCRYVKVLKNCATAKILKMHFEG